MPSTLNASASDRREVCFAVVVFMLCLAFNIWGVHVGWQSQNLPGHEFRQAQTALSAFHIQQEHDFSVDYPTPVLGKPWSIPLEFPLYQWTAVGLSNWSGLDLVKSGRVVSVACFYLMLPAIFLLLGNRAVAPRRRWLVLALVVTCPLYIFYTRAFLIETMALMFSLWFWVAFERAVANRDWCWLGLAMFAGAGAGLVKVPTLFVYMLPAAWWAIHRLWQARRGREWRTDFVWMAAAVVLPLAVSIGWKLHADGVRALNPLAHFLLSEEFHDFNFGTWATRLSPELWQQKWNTLIHSVTWWPVLVACLGMLFFSSRSRVRQGLALAGFFAAPLMVFPVLYGFHDYYFVANSALLLAGMGLVVIGVAESSRHGWLAALLTLALAGGQAFRYHNGYYEEQKTVSAGGDSLTRSLRAVVKPDEVIVVVGQQWNPMLPYYTQRRAMMIRQVDEKNPARLDAAFAALAGEKAGALLISNSVRDPAEFLQRAAALGIGSIAVYRWHDVTVYLREDNLDASVRKIQHNGDPGLSWIPGMEPKPDRLAAAWFEVGKLRPEKRDMFSEMHPQPVRFYASFGLAMDFEGGRRDFGAHPVTRLVFSLAAGVHTLRTTLRMPPAGYDPSLPPDQRTDGVAVKLTTLEQGGSGKELYARLMNPRDNPDDRGPIPLEIAFQLDQAGEVELFFGPGPAGRDTRDTILMSRLDIQ